MAEVLKFQKPVRTGAAGQVADPFPTLKQGDAGGIVIFLQKKLKQAGQDFGQMTEDRFGPKTEKAVRAFQGAKKLSADGIVGPITWAALERVVPFQQQTADAQSAQQGQQSSQSSQQPQAQPSGVADLLTTFFQMPLWQKALVAGGVTMAGYLVYKTVAPKLAVAGHKERELNSAPERCSRTPSMRNFAEDGEVLEAVG